MAYLRIAIQTQKTLVQKLSLQNGRGYSQVENLWMIRTS